MATDEGDLPHLTASGRARMVDVGHKAVTGRTAVATGVLRVTPETAARIADGTLPKGDALTVARIAGIQAAKHTWELIPLCHQVALSSVDVDATVDVAAGEVHLTATARSNDRTGVEMEALTAVSIAGLALYDLVKAVQKDAVLDAVQLESKTGGARGDYHRDGAQTVADRPPRGADDHG